MEDLFAKTQAQAEVLIPVIKALRKEIGQDAADRLMMQALSEWATSLGESIRDSSDKPPLKKLRDAIEACDAQGLQTTTFLRDTPDRLDYDIHGCRVAHFYRSLGIGDIGHVLVCRLDDAIMPAIDPAIEMTRNQTIMQGAPHCEFRMRLRDPSEARSG